MPRRSAHRTTRAYRTTRVRRYHRHRKSNKLGKNLVHAAVLFLLFTGSVLFILGLFFYKKISQEFASASSPNAYSVKNRDIFTLLYISDEQYTFNIFDTNNKKVIIYSIPSNVILDVPGKYGEEELSKVIALGDLDGKRGLPLMSQSVSKLFGFGVDKYLYSDHPLTFSLKDFYQGIKSTNLSLNESYYIYSFFKSLPSDRFIRKDFNSAYVANSESLDDALRELTFDSKIALEKKSVAVLNGAETPGLAGFASRLIQNEGGWVVSEGNTIKPYEESMLIVDDLESETVKEIVHSLGIKKVLLKNQVNIDQNEVDRSDIVVILGLDIKDLL